MFNSAILGNTGNNVYFRNITFCLPLFEDYSDTKVTKYERCYGLTKDKICRSIIFVIV